MLNSVTSSALSAPLFHAIDLIQHKENALGSRILDTKMSTQETFCIRGEFITLDALLKAAGIAESGGQAKEMIQSGGVFVDGAQETRRGRKLRGGEIVEAADRVIRLLASSKD